MNQKELIDYAHKLKMEELDYKLKIAEQKHEWRKESMRIFFSEQKKHADRKQREKEFSWK